MRLRALRALPPCARRSSAHQARAPRLLLLQASALCIAAPLSSSFCTCSCAFRLRQIASKLVASSSSGRGPSLPIVQTCPLYPSFEPDLPPVSPFEKQVCENARPVQSLIRT